MMEPKEYDVRYHVLWIGGNALAAVTIILTWFNILLPWVMRMHDAGSEGQAWFWLIATAAMTACLCVHFGWQVMKHAKAIREHNNED